MKFRWLRLVMCVGVLASVVPVLPASASRNSCSVTYSPMSVSPGRASNFAFDVYNGGSEPFTGLMVSVPADSGVMITSGSSRNFTMDAGDGSMATYTGGSLDPGVNQVFNLQATAGPDEGAMGDWTVTLFDSANETSVTCTGSLGLMVATQPSDIVISNVNVINIGLTAATITWNTNEPANSQVSYGADSTYGSQSTLKPALILDHSVTIMGLASNKLYHFAATSGTQQAGDMVTSGDSTFYTLAPVVVSKSVSPGGVAPRGTVAIGLTPAETVPPTVVVTTSVAKPFTKAPVVDGTASDNVAVARIDYSLDGGKSWVVLPNPPGLGTKVTHFSLTLNGLEDNNYSLVMRATDTSGNVATTTPATLVVDLQPPRIGAELIAFGPQPAVRDGSGRWLAAVGIDQTATMNAVGGPVRISIAATRAGSKGVGHNFYLRQDVDSGLWSGLVSFNVPGTYHLVAMAVDGAGNKTSRTMSDVVVSPSARVLTAGGQPLGNVKLTLYYRQPASGRWLVWDGAPYGEPNPQQTTPAGGFALLAPAGEYYLKAEAPGYRTLVTRQFKVAQSMPVVPVLSLAASPKLRVGNWSWTLPGITLSQTGIDPRGGYDGAESVTSALVGHNFPAFRLPKTTGETVTPVSFQGKPTVVTVLSTWAPPSAEQLPALQAVAKGLPGVNVVPLYLGERTGKVQAALVRAGYDLPAVVDSKALLGDQLGVPNVPTQYFVDRTGKVVSVHVGVMPEAELRQRLLSGL